MQRRNEPIIIMILRILLGCVFIFSGLTKAIDPIANAIQFDDYFISFRMPFMQLFSMFKLIRAEFSQLFHIWPLLLLLQGI